MRACFIDWQKVSDQVNWKKLRQVLKEIGIDSRETRLISKLYLDQRVNVQLDRGETRKCEDWKRTLHVPYLCITEYYYTCVTDQQMNTNKMCLSYTIIYQQLLVTWQPSAGCHTTIQTAAQKSHNNTTSCTKVTQQYKRLHKSHTTIQTAAQNI